VTGIDRRIAELGELVEGLAAEELGRASGRTTVGRERALLRLLGVSGLDAAGRPLAAEVVDRYVAGGPGRLGAGVGLPFAMAAVEYDLPPQQLALDIAAGTIDLAMEAELLTDPGRRAGAVAEFDRLLGAAYARSDANRTARTELIDVLGDPPRPLVGLPLQGEVADAAIADASDLVRAGVDLVQVEVPAGRELVARMTAAGVEISSWVSPSGSDEDGDGPAPAGSQRGLAALRAALDEDAAARGAYVRLASVAPALGGPESAAVASVERVDLIVEDPIAEIVGSGIDPDRALADHVFTARLLARAGAGMLLGPGAVAVAPDLAAGRPADPATRAGRALGLQLLAAALAARAGLPPDALQVAALPSWIAGEDRPVARAAAEIVLRRTLLAHHPLALVEPEREHGAWPRWAFVMAALLPAPPVGALVVRQRRDVREGDAAWSRVAARLAGEVRSAASVAQELGSGFADRQPRELSGPAREHAEAALAAAVSTLRDLATSGWAGLLEAGAGEGALRIGGDAVAPRPGGPDPYIRES
jgi:hypothetical protein